MKLWKTEVRIYKEKKYSFERDSFIQEEIEILGENDEFFCLNDRTFTTIKRFGNTGAYDVVGKERIRIEDGGGFLGSAMTKGVFYTLYSVIKKRPSTVRKEIEKSIEKKYGWIAGINLGIIK